ncbi:MAG TPA: HPF/RaiA family ribosome-associated protein [Cyclobacteriaceae bacterium]|jgi:ribosomal subunit interface protein|nr:HPF/RaiA family ribosome-associated protein [Cyclobacteriaceae bacterium]
MKTQIQSLGFDANRDLLNLIDKKLEKIGQLSDRILEGKVVLKIDKSDTRENKICEIRLAIPGNDLFAKKMAESFEQAVDQVMHALEKQVHDWKTKLHDRQVKIVKE